MPDDLTDLILLSRSGDEQAFATLIRRYRRLLHTIARQYLSSYEDIDDAVQVCMWKAWRHLPTYRSGNFRSWLCTIMQNTCKDMLRRQRRQRRWIVQGDISDLWSVADRRSNPEQQWLEEDDYNECVALLALLIPKHKAAMEMIVIRKLSYEEAAQLLAVPVGTVKSRVSRGRAALKERIGR